MKVASRRAAKAIKTLDAAETTDNTMAFLKDFEVSIWLSTPKGPIVTLRCSIQKILIEI